MAATDKPFNNQRTLDIVFAVSNILMLLSIIWMLWQDHYREYKVEQRLFRDIETMMAQRAALDAIPLDAEFASAKEALKAAMGIRDDEANKSILREARAALAGLQPKKERAEARFQAAKADVESINSFLSIALEHRDDALAKKYRDDLKKLNEKLDEMTKERDDLVALMKAEQRKIDDKESPVTKALGEFKRVNDKLDSQVKLAISKRWGWGDWFRTLWVIDGFANPLKIHQFTLNDLPIDYNFKQVTRYDRCLTCHLGIDKANFTPENLNALTGDAANKDNLKKAQDFYDARRKEVEKDPAALANFLATTPNPHSISLMKISDKQLTPARIKQFAAHPRLDLFVGGNSKHPAERFGCSSCHYGQGSGTTFLDASHNPNSSSALHAWERDRGWEHNHMWDFPMLPTRFTEASCIKCHHEVSDLVSTDNRVEAPKVYRGFNLIKENGCFGCHEISGWKSGNRIGPDLRLEPSTPLEDMNPIERDRAVKDTDNRPGSLRKVGPSLARLKEKTTLSFVERWIRSPSSFRPDTKMPHYYGLSTNNEKFLKDEFEHSTDAHAISQEKFPNTEIASIAYFLMRASQKHLDDTEKLRADGNGPKDENRLVALLSKDRLTGDEAKDLAEVKRNIQLRKQVKLVDLAPNYAGDVKNGRVLFTERGCLSCHVHKGTEVVQGSRDVLATFSPAIEKNEAVFGPSLSQLVGKFGKSKEEQADARKWLIQWITDPHVHSPRSRMPVTHLAPKEAADIAAWLLNQSATDHGDDWDEIHVKPPLRKELEDLAKVYLTRMMSKSDMVKFLNGDLKDDFELIKKDLTADEQQLYPKIKDDNELKAYLGKKAVSRLGCYACHDIPGFENAKSIGVGLNDWGKKPADRLAFEDIDNFFKTKYYYQGVDSLVDKDGKPHGIKDGKEPYEEFYAQALMGHHRQREGYLNQKIRDPRSYDFNRVRAWDDRARMPEFHFARARKQETEKADEYKARILKNEAEARESVATFVLGLTAEQVPTKNINQPTGDRLAEVKGRQILEKYNCNGCHTVRPGVYDFNLTPATLAKLDKFYGDERNTMKGEIEFLDHTIWSGRNSMHAGEPLKVRATAPRYLLDRDETPLLLLHLSEALRFPGGDFKVRTIPGSTDIVIPMQDVLGARVPVKSQDDIGLAFGPSNPFGGAFTELMVPYLLKKYPEKFTGPDATRTALPPPLIGQGERTQPEWLKKFLLEPQQVRNTTILRMPKFNMSQDEATALVDYFAAVTKQTNVGIGLTYPFVSPQARDDLDGAYWRKKNAQYVARLKTSKALDKDSKPVKSAEGKELTAYEQRLEYYAPVWEQLRKDLETGLKADISKLEETIKVQTMDKERRKKLIDEKKGNAQDLQKEIDSIDLVLKGAGSDKQMRENDLANLSVKTLQTNWEEKEAYAADAYRLLTSRELCSKCHQVGSIRAGEQKSPGPHLDLAAERLRPGFIQHWVSKPARLVYFTSMTQYFKKDSLEYQQIHAGASLEQIDALRDVLLNLPRVSSMPINRLHHPDLPVPKK